MMAAVSNPKQQGYRMPAEWSAHEGTWFSWPHNPETWPGVLPGAEAALIHAVHALRRDETVHLNVLDPEHEAHVRTLLGTDTRGVRFHHIATNDAWCRDHGAIFVVGTTAPASRLAVNWGFNAWAANIRPTTSTTRCRKRWRRPLAPRWSTAE